MSIFDMAKGLAGGATNHPTLALAIGMAEKCGGIEGLLAALKQGGLEPLVQSWLGAGANQPVTGQQLGQALAGTPAGQHVEAEAAQQGVAASSLFSQLAKHLPEVVNQLSPNGQVAAGGFNLGQLAGLAGKLGL